MIEKKKYEIWIGNYHLGQGYGPSDKPQKLGEVEATSFKIACCIYEHQKSIDFLNGQMDRGETYIEDAHFGKWYYNPDGNYNNWVGRYFETEEEASKSFT
tara:strand:- start:86 stop:385 length:300 start_codon:yes stop_codon:yes gene_type:complete